MKKTHKALMGVTALVVAFSAFSFAACGGGNDGTIKGNYKEATSEEVSEALSTVSAETLFGDTNAENYKFGVDVSAKLECTSYYQEKLAETMKMEASYKELAKKENSEIDVKGAGSLKMNYKTEMSNVANSLGQFSNIKVDLYQEATSLYASLAYAEKESDLSSATPMKVMVNIAELMGGSGMMPMSADTTPTTTSELTAALEMLTQMGATTSMDTSDGVKLKISANETFVNNLIVNMAGIPAESLTQLVTFNTCKIDIYLAIDKNGQFSQAGVVFDVDLKLGTAITQGMPMSDVIKLKGNVSVKVDNNVNPATPSGFNSAEYLDITSSITGSGNGFI